MDWERQESRERSLVELVADARRELELARAVRGRSQRGSRRVQELPAASDLLEVILL